MVTNWQELFQPLYANYIWHILTSEIISWNVILNACHPECSILMWDLPISVRKQILLRQAVSLHVNHLCSHLNNHHRSLLISLVSSLHRVLRCLVSIHLSKVNYSISLFLFNYDCMLYVYHFSSQLLRWTPQLLNMCCAVSWLCRCWTSSSSLIDFDPLVLLLLSLFTSTAEPSFLPSSD